MYKFYIQSELTSERGVGTSGEHWARIWKGLPVQSITRGVRRSLEWREIQRRVPPGSRVLEAGCGLGQWVVLFAEEGLEPVGLDISVELINRLQQELPGYRWVSGDVCALPFEDESFDSVVSWGVIEHFEEGPAAPLGEFWRVLRPGGWLFVTVPFLCWRRRREFAGRETNRESLPAESSQFYQYLMSEGELRECVAGVGFDVQRIVPTGGPEGLIRLFGFERGRKLSLFKRCILRVADVVLPRGLSSLMVLAVARKPERH